MIEVGLRRVENKWWGGGGVPPPSTQAAGTQQKEFNPRAFLTKGSTFIRISGGGQGRACARTPPYV